MNTFRTPQTRKPVGFTPPGQGARARRRAKRDAATRPPSERDVTPPHLRTPAHSCCHNYGPFPHIRHFNEEGCCCRTRPFLPQTGELNPYDPPGENFEATWRALRLIGDVLPAMPPNRAIAEGWTWSQAAVIVAGAIVALAAAILTLYIYSALR